MLTRLGSGKEIVGVFSLLLLVIGCGSVTATPPDSGSGPEAGSDSISDVARELAPAGDAPTEAPGPSVGTDARDVALEAQPTVSRCGGRKTLHFDERCTTYSPGVQCVTNCDDEIGQQHPNDAEQLSDKLACQANGLPAYVGTLVCVRSCAACPTAPVVAPPDLGPQCSAAYKSLCLTYGDGLRSCVTGCRDLAGAPWPPSGTATCVEPGGHDFVCVPDCGACPAT